MWPKKKSNNGTLSVAEGENHKLDSRNEKNEDAVYDRKLLTVNCSLDLGATKQSKACNYTVIVAWSVRTCTTTC